MPGAKLVCSCMARRGDVLDETRGAHKAGRSVVAINLVCEVQGDT